MYELKFRAWDKIAKIFHHDFQFIRTGVKGGDWTLFVSDRQPLSNYDGWAKSPYCSQQFLVEQYTGLTDKNGVEIYEGDFLSCKNSGQSGYDEADPNRRVVKRDPKTHQLVLFGSIDARFEASGFGLSETTRGRWTVTGNIHEGNKK